MDIELACEALRSGRVLEANYEGHVRSLEVHVVGYHENEGIMRVWQIRGGSSSQQPTGWKLMYLKKVRNAAISAEQSQAPRPGFKRNDPAMSRILCEV